MIDLTNIIQTTQKIDTLYESTLIAPVVGMVLLFVIILGSMIPAQAMFKLWPLIGLVFIMIPIVMIYDDHIEKIDIREELGILRDSRDLEYTGMVKDSSCEEVREHIVKVIEDEHVDYIEDKTEWVQDLYYHKCEVPLREEILKLQ